jgi:A/G-specific adenine glycosylase
MMDLGATICTTRAPRCLLCPLQPQCRAQAAMQAEDYPVKAPRRARPERRGRAFWITRDGAVWLVRREARGMLGGMRALPDDGWSAGRDGSGSAPLAGPWRVVGEVTHMFTHFTLRLELALYSGSDWASLAAPDGEWWPLDRLDAAGLPTLYARAAAYGAITTG